MALAPTTLTIDTGITGLLGPNGAGKSTLLSLLATRRAPSSGRLSVLGHDVRASEGREHVRTRIGYLAQRYPLVGSMRVLDTLAYAAWAQGVERAQAYDAAVGVTELLELEALRSRRVSSLSGGQRQRVGLGAAMVHAPDLLLLDEPTAGLDPEARMAIRRTLKRVAATSSIVLSTHLVDDVLAICGSIVVLDRGGVLFQGPPTELEQQPGDLSDSSGSSLELGYESVLVAGRARAAR